MPSLCAVSLTALIFAACCFRLTSCRFPPKSPSSILIPIAPAFRISVTDSSAASGVSPYPASRSIDTGTDTAAVIRDTRPVTISNGTFSPSAYPNADATAALLVATAGDVFAMASAVATSQTLNRMSGFPLPVKTVKRLGVLLLRLGVHRAPPGQKNPKDVVPTAGPASAICVQSPQCSGPNLGDEPRDRLAILVGRILLQKVKAFDRYGLLVRLGAAEVPRA